jgi:lactoylglutathione lyase
VASMWARLRQQGVRARSVDAVDITAGPNAGARSIYLADPDGYPVELFQKRPGA